MASTKASRPLVAVTLALALLLAIALGGTQASAAARVSIDGFAYKPATLRVDKGTTVTFANNSGSAHTATRKGGFDTGRIKPGKAVAIRFSQRGSFAYHCTIHPFMRGKVVVD